MALYSHHQNCTKKHCQLSTVVIRLKPVGLADVHSVKRSCKRSRSNFDIICLLLGKIYSLIKNNSVCTKRELYYQCIKFIDSQWKVHNAVNHISCMLDVPPWSLRIMATSKGLVYGDVDIISSENKVSCNASGGTLIPQDINKIQKIEARAYFVLVIEKDSVFQKLLDEDLPNKLTRPFVMVTGKGYPDINTRLFIRRLWLELRIPVFILVDADPFGIDIMLTYRFGSLKLSHVSDYLALPHMRWLGVHPSEIKSLGVDSQPLTERDTDKIKQLLSRPYMNENLQIKEELNYMLKNKYKAEIEGLIKSHTFLADNYLPIKFFNHDFL